jgi:hypothetical protein
LALAPTWPAKGGPCSPRASCARSARPGGSQLGLGPRKRHPAWAESSPLGQEAITAVDSDRTIARGYRLNKTRGDAVSSETLAISFVSVSSPSERPSQSESASDERSHREPSRRRARPPYGERAAVERHRCGARSRCMASTARDGSILSALGRRPREVWSSAGVPSTSTVDGATREEVSPPPFRRPLFWLGLGFLFFFSISTLCSSRFLINATRLGVLYHCQN